MIGAGVAAVRAVSGSALKTGNIDPASATVKIPRDVLARYVGVYKGIYGGAERTYEVSLSGDQLIAIR